MATSSVKASRFIESCDDKRQAFRRCSSYSVSVAHDPTFAGWPVTVKVINTPTGEAFGVYAVNELDESKGES